jgi:hypothetical protein
MKIFRLTGFFSLRRYVRVIHLRYPRSPTSFSFVYSLSFYR